VQKQSTKEFVHYFPLIIKLVLKKRNENKSQIQCCMKNRNSARKKDRMQGQKWKWKQGTCCMVRYERKRTILFTNMQLEVP